MMNNHASVEQGTDAWRMARLGHVTASRISDVVARTKSGWSATRNNYMTELMLERLTGKPTVGYVSPAMARGTEVEPLARAAYAFAQDAAIERVGYCPHPSIPMTGASPDGLVGAHGLVEFKCPIAATHLDTLLGASIDGGYVLQMQWQMACTGRDWCDWISYHPDFPAGAQMVVWRVGRHQAVINDLADAVMKFQAELDDKLKELRARIGAMS